jgi:hypothetical protein
MGRIDCAPKTLLPIIAPQLNLLFYIELFFFGEQNINKLKKIDSQLAVNISLLLQCIVL